jgi:hypothetical protein
MKHFLLTRNEMTAAGVTRSAITLDVVKLHAKMQNAPQVIASVVDPSRWLVVTPGGSVMGTSLTPMGAAEAEELAWNMAARMGWADPQVKMDGRVGA